VYARANGYVRKWLVDIGAHVKKGQVWPSSTSPTSTRSSGKRRRRPTRPRPDRAGQDAARARADHQRALRALGPSGVVTQQEVDQYRAGYDAQQANVAAAEAPTGARWPTCSASRPEELRRHRGSVRRRRDGATAEVGQLVTPGTGMGQPLFKVAEVDTSASSSTCRSSMRAASRGDGRSHDVARARAARSRARSRERRTSSTRARARSSRRSTSRTPTTRSSRACTAEGQARASPEQSTDPRA
jgi:multidrug efflux pump subunit AcrA (membrane-fusion protein)